MVKYIESKDIPVEDKVYVKKDMFGWRIVHPIEGPDGKYNWLNLLFGGKRNAVMLIIVLALASYALWAYNKDISVIENKYKEISDNPLAFCRNIKGGNLTVIYPDLNFTKFINGVEKPEG